MSVKNHLHYIFLEIIITDKPKLMKSLFKSFLTLIMLCSLTSCFEVIDEIDLKKDGSGEFLLTLNMSKSKTKIESIMLMDSFRGHKVPTKDDVEKYIDDLVVLLNESEGISNVEQTIDFDEFIFTLGFHFSSVENINTAIDKLASKDTKNSDSFNLRFAYNKSTKEFSRYYEPNSENKVDYENLEEEDKNTINEAIFVSICRFEYNVSSCSNTKAKISKSGNAVMMRSSAINILKGNTKISNTIQLK